MSMIGQFISVTPGELDEYLNDSSLLEKRYITAFEDDDSDDDDPAFFDVHKAWDAISFLLTGCSQEQFNNAAPPLSWVIFGDRIIDPEQNLGYGPASYLTSEQVQKVHLALTDVSVDDLKKNYDGKKMTALEIYPGDWTDSVESEDWLFLFFEKLKIFYANAAENKSAVITFLS
jgi:hypothetical protein